MSLSNKSRNTRLKNLQSQVNDSRDPELILNLSEPEEFHVFLGIIFELCFENIFDIEAVSFQSLEEEYSSKL